jgi:hypothetical protein
MSVETPQHPSPRSAPETALREYVTSLRNPDEVSELILLLEARQQAREDAPPADPGLQALGRATGLDWSAAEAVKTAVLALGERARQLASRPPRELPEVGVRDLPGLSTVLLAQVEAVRIADPNAAADALRDAAEATLELYRRNAPPRSEEEHRWRDHVEEAVRDRFVPAYVNAARRVNAVEDGAFTGPLLRSPFALALLIACVGLLSFPVPLSTPILCVVLGLLGAFLVHPAWLRQIAQPLRDTAENLAGEQARIERLTSSEPWTAADLRLDAVVEDLLPILENTRGAGRTREDELRPVVHAYLDEIEPHAVEVGRSEANFQLLRRFCEGRLVRDYARYATARQRWEGTFLVRVLDTPWAAAIATGIATLPLSVISALVSPFPPGIDLPLMIIVFTMVGGFLPRLLPGTLPALRVMMRELVSHQTEIDNLG